MQFGHLKVSWRGTTYPPPLCSNSITMTTQNDYFCVFMGTSTLGLRSPLSSHSEGNSSLNFTEGFCLPAAEVTSFVEKRAALATQKCCCVKVAAVPPCVLVSRSDASAHPCSHLLPPQFYSGIFMCKYLLIPPPSLSFSLLLPLSTLSLFINGPHSLPLTLCMPVCPSPPALPLYSLL